MRKIALTIAAAAGVSALSIGALHAQGAPQLQQQQQQQPASAASQNQLFPSDLIAQPFHVSELYNPPPPIHLPANAAATPSEFANESSKYLRCTLNTIPTNHSLLKKSKLPFALVISPYASLHDSEDPCPSSTTRSSAAVDDAAPTSTPSFPSSTTGTGGGATCAT